MATYTGQQRFLLRDADKYLGLGYRVGLAKEKKFVKEYKQNVVTTFWGPMQTTPDIDVDFDGISVIPDEIVCVDIDVPDFGVVYEELPPTWKEKTPRGWHLWYRLPQVIGAPWAPQIKWRPHVDLLTKEKVVTLNLDSPVKRRSRYDTGEDDDQDEPVVTSHWGEHVLCSGTTGYIKMWPDEIPHRDKLPLAPQWLQDALLK